MAGKDYTTLGSVVYVERINTGAGERYALMDGNLFIPSREMWLKIRELCDAFYAAVTDEEIQDYNERNEERVQAYLAEQNRPSKSEPKGPKPRPGFIYLLTDQSGLYKIGFTRDLNGRLRSYKTHNSNQARYIHVIPSEDMIRDEEYLKDFFAEKRQEGEWFNL